jgi:hypothetical protein
MVEDRNRAFKSTRTGGENLNIQKNITFTWSSINATSIELGLIPGCCSETKVTNCLSYSIAFLTDSLSVYFLLKKCDDEKKSLEGTN